MLKYITEEKETDRVLDMGTGSGIQAILAASKSSNVVAVDMNPFAVKCTKLNVNLNKLSSRIQVETSFFSLLEVFFYSSPTSYL